MTVAQLEQTLDAEVAAHKQDIEISRKISGIELSERITDESISHLSKQFPDGSKAAMALLLLADRSAFLDPPASELPSTPAPDAAGQRHLIEAAQKFAIETLPRLPNLLATRTTFSFDDSPQEVSRGAYAQRLGLHLIGSSKAEVSVRNEREGQSRQAGSGRTQGSRGLATWGEFGSTLLIILSDSAQGKTVWSHWEQTSSGLMAVFHYEVPKDASHYEIDTSVQEIQANGESGRWAGARARDAGTISSWNRMVHSKPAYQGSLWINPATGTITRVTLVADLRGNATFERGAILVDYGPVKVGDQTLTAPVRSLALSAAPHTVDATFSQAATEWLNENLFTDYHIFASTVRIVSEEASAPISAPTAGQTPQTPAASARAALASQAQEGPGRSAGEVSVEQAGEAAPATSAEVVRAPQPVPSGGEQSRSASDTVAEVSSAQPSVKTSAPQPVAPLPSTDQVPVFRVNVNSLLVPVVVRDKQGHAVGDLTANDFRVLDQGKLQTIAGMTLVRSTAHEGEPGNPSEAPGENASEGGKQNRFIVFLFDDRHLDSSDLARTQEAATKVLSQGLAPNEYAAVVSLMGVNSGVTQDRAALLAAIKGVSTHRSFQHDARDCPDIDYYSADKILNQHDETEFQIAVAKVDACNGTTAVASGNANTMGQIEAPINADQRLALSAARRSLAVGEEDARESINAVGSVVRAMSKLSGQRTLILLSPGFLSLSPSVMSFKSQLFDQAAASSVVINTLDARGLYAGNVDASQGGTNVFLSQRTGQTSQNQLNAMVSSENALAEMANGTGGKFFHNNNDLETGLKALMVPPDYVYLLEISLKNVKPAGAYHRLDVKVGRDGLHVDARRGYFAPKEAKGK
jgi:VWFA-related protein